MLLFRARTQHRQEPQFAQHDKNPEANVQEHITQTWNPQYSLVLARRGPRVSLHPGSVNQKHGTAELTALHHNI